MCYNPNTTEEVKSKIDDIKARIVDLEPSHPKVYQPLKPLLMDLLVWLRSADAVIARHTLNLRSINDRQKKQADGVVTIVVNGKSVDVG